MAGHRTHDERVGFRVGGRINKYTYMHFVLLIDFFQGVGRQDHVVETVRAAAEQG